MEYSSIDTAPCVASSEAFSGWKMHDREGGGIPPHATPQDVLFYVLEGHGTFTVGSEEGYFGPHTLFSAPGVFPMRYGTKALKISVFSWRSFPLGNRNKGQRLKKRKIRKKEEVSQCRNS